MAEEPTVGSFLFDSIHNLGVLRHLGEGLANQGPRTSEIRLIVELL